jgi:hypothetical protein
MASTIDEMLEYADELERMGRPEDAETLRKLVERLMDLRVSHRTLFDAA